MMTKRLAIYVLISLITISVYIPGVTNALLADDWPVIARNMDLSWPGIFRLFLATRAGWYRPVFDLFIGLCVRIFGLNAVGYHGVIIGGIYVALVVLVGVIAEAITGERAIGILSSFFFGIHGVHAEPVLWISASNELLAGLFVLLSLKCYIMFRASDRPVLSYCFTGIFYLLSIASKETAVFLPIMFVAYDWYRLDPRAREFDLHTLLPTAPFLLLQVVFISFRLVTGSPYPISVPPIRVVINPLYYLAVEVFTLPDNYGYLTSLPLWQQSPILPVLAMSASFLSLGIFIWLYSKFARLETPLPYTNPLKFTCSWSLVALYPVILTATARTAFMSSIGVTWSIAILVFLVWNSVKAKRASYKRLFVWAVVLFASVNLGVSCYRAYWWRQAGHTMQSVLSQLSYELESVPSSSRICVVGLPDHLRHAYTFRNAFPSINRLIYPNRNIQVVLGSELNGPRESYVCMEGVGFQYNGDSLERFD